MGEISRLIEKIEKGEESASEELLPKVYDELRKLAARKLSSESCTPSLQATVLVHDAYVRLVDNAAQQTWSGRGHFFAAAAEAMRRILIEHARRKRTLKHGAKNNRVALENAEPSTGENVLDLLALDEVLQQFEQLWPEKAKIVKLRYFAGLTSSEAARAMGISDSTAERHWKFAKAWLFAKLDAKS